MKTSTASKGHPHLDYLFQVAVIAHLTHDPATRTEAEQELRRFRDDGLIIQRFKESNMGKKKTRSGREDTPVFSGQGIIFAVIDDREEMGEGRVTTIDVITQGIEAALDAGHETSEEIARYLTTSAFQHVPDKRVRFNSVLKAGDVVGAHILRKLYNAYNELEVLAEDEPDKATKVNIQAEARGFAEALTIVLSPFSVEDREDYRLVNWDEVDRITEAFIKEQRFVRKERKGTPQ